MRPPLSDERIYHIRSKEQVIERCRSMLGSVEEVAVIDIFPGPLEELRPVIERAAVRGVGVRDRKSIISPWRFYLTGEERKSRPDSPRMEDKYGKLKWC